MFSSKSVGHGKTLNLEKLNWVGANALSVGEPFSRLMSKTGLAAWALAPVAGVENPAAVARNG